MLWDLIREWRSVRDDAERIEVQARKARQHATELETQLVDVLIQVGPVMACSELYFPPENPNDPIRIQSVKDAISIVLPEPENPNPEGGVA